MTNIKLPAPPELIPVMVNGEEMMLPKGRNLLQSLLDAGHYIPHYCYHPALPVSGNCRLCLVEIEGRPKPEVACNMVVSPDLKIITNSELVENCRKGMMEFLLVNHPLDCPVCDRGGECMLQRYSMDYGIGTARMQDAKRRVPKPQLDPLIDIERNRCIMCTRCVRFSDHVGGEHTMAVFQRGDRNYIGTYGDGPVGNLFSGNVIDLCPVGCLTSKPFRFSARVWELRQTPTASRICNGALTAWTRGGKLMRVTPPPRRRRGQYTIDEDTTKFISNEARFGSLYANNEERILTPIAKSGGQLKPIEWDEAIRMTAEALKADGPEATAILAGERSTNEEFFLLGRIARERIGTNMIDWRGRFINEDAAHAVGAAMSASDGDFDLLASGAYASTVMIDANLLETSPDIAIRIREAARLGHTSLGTIGPRTDHWFAKAAKTVCLETPGELPGVLGKLAEAHTAGTELEGYANIQNLLKAEQGLLVLGLDSAGGAFNGALVPAALKLLEALGEGWQFLPVTAARNAKGAFASGAQSDYQGAPAILEMAAQGRIKTLFLHRADELVNHPRRAWIESALDKVERLIVTDIFPSWITEKADIVLPGTVFYETDGSMTDIDGSLRKMSLGARAKGKAQEEWRILLALDKALGGKSGVKRASDVFAALSEVWGAKGSIKLDDYRFDAPGFESPQRPSIRPKKELPAFKLHHRQRPALDASKMPATGGLRLLWIQHCQGFDHLGSRSTEFDALRPTPKLELCPADAQKSGLTVGDWAVLEGVSDTPSQIDINPRLAEGLVFGAANVFGLRIDGDALPAVSLKKVEAPIETTNQQEAGATA